MSDADLKAAARAARTDANLAAIKRHLAECVDLAERGRDAFLGPDFVNRYAALAALIQTGNAVKDLPDEFRAAHPDVRWRALMGTRDKIGHIYGDSVDWDALWNTVARDVPNDLAAVRRAVAQRR
ncbi:MAG: HepT-like ribonuclease domain-containing protein [Pseudolysinimonas sp.]|uniref:HepT-like ribonuclease domain-containing protein n=1 Tax=Pseudolysinimonas sp. TaxID=2680009 RepID=UPI00326520AB